ncbi:Lrp/AsnC family transcriptional regulator [Sphingosinicella rhizophila]|uniref:Lrp/AsnC family transcriptional regulator n=1 Tax=Sphingosinicella rhizophila TaxID=3050082 RepID=A0ABU3QDJ9_9SPHN|nr:Lrp/AsnC family transcriptional regulator [Sphingosinicella sp. GR2756]MDT9601045.1 Lrp/AsnC family transcriptional regulator [Sphingosinicella sp. GR2756]
MVTVDEADRRILTQLRLNGRITNSALATEIGLSPSACLRRVKLLEKRGVIRGYTAIVSSAMPEEGTIAIVQVELERQSEEFLVRFENALRKHPEIQEWYLMTGAGDYILRIQIADIDDYGQFHREVLSRLPGVSRITSSFAMRSNLRA